MSQRNEEIFDVELWVEIVGLVRKKNKEDYIAYHHIKNYHGENRQYADLRYILK